jgi:hypothetical protein
MQSLSIILQCLNSKASSSTSKGVPDERLSSRLRFALQLGVDSESLEGKQLTATQLMQAIADHLQDNVAFTTWKVI